MMYRSSLLLMLVAVFSAGVCMAEDLKPVSAFSSITDRTARSAALFTEAARVLEHPRCLNCHPVDRTPTQGNDLHPHNPLIRADNEGHGPPGLPCNTCHQAQN